MNSRGVCALCLKNGPLSFEHVPPRRAFNNHSAVAHTIFGLHTGNRYGKGPIVLKAPRGLGRHSLCENCNGNTAAWYGDAFADWTAQCLRFAEKVGRGNQFALPFHIQPLNVIKQIATMILAVSELKIATPHIDALRHFVLSPNSMWLPNGLYPKCYLNPVDKARLPNPLLTQNRLVESCCVLNARDGCSVLVIGEVAFPPMGYVIYSAAAQQPVSQDFRSLCDLRGLGNHQYGARADLFLRMPVRYPFGPVPGYYPDITRPGNHKYLDDNHILLTTKH